MTRGEVVGMQIGLVKSFAVRVVSGESDPHAPGGVAAAGDGLTFVVVAEGQRAEGVRDWAGVGQVTGPDGFSALVFADLDSATETGHFASRSFVYDAPAGEYVVDWEFRRGEELHAFRSETFAIPARVHLPADATEADWDSA